MPTKKAEEIQEVIIPEGSAIIPNLAPNSVEFMEAERWAEQFKAHIPSGDIAKAGPPNLQPFTTITTVPNVAGNGVLPWPGTDPQNLKRLGRQHIAVNLILSQRVADVLQYSQESKYLWKPGWRIVSMLSDESKDSKVATNKKMLEACQYIRQCHLGDHTVEELEQNRIRSFPQFLAAATRDLLTYDAVAIWKNQTVSGRVQAFAGLDTSQINLIDRTRGYLQDKKVIAISQNTQMQETVKFTNKNLIWGVMNPRNDSDIYGYGYSPIDILANLIYAFTNAVALNSSTFDKNSVPQGILKLAGKFTQKDVNALTRLWVNMKTGTSKAWTFPVINVPPGGDISILDLTQIKGNEVYYKEFMNMLMGAICAVWNFPIRRLGYHISGSTRDAQPNANEQQVTWRDEADVGKTILLQFFEDLINTHLMAPTFPDLRFMFTGKSPKEDAREFEMRSLSLTLDERREMVGLPKISELVTEESEEAKVIAEMLGLTPVDPALVGSFQTIVSLFKQNKAGTPGAKFPGQQDAAESERHGDMAGVRRSTPK